MYLEYYPILTFALSFGSLWLATWVGSALSKRWRPLAEDDRDDFRIVQGAALTLLGLLLGFTFSMAVSRYDLRKNYEEAEANAIGTEYVRADLLPLGDATKVRDLLKKYLDQRLLFYTTTDQSRVAKTNADTAALQSELWSAVRESAVAHPTPVIALAVAGMNDVLNSQGYTQAAWWNRLPPSAWALLGTIAIGCHVLIGYGSKGRNQRTLLVLPIAISIALFLISDIDSPRRGTIHVAPQNLLSLSRSLAAE